MRCGRRGTKVTRIERQQGTNTVLPSMRHTALIAFGKYRLLVTFEKIVCFCGVTNTNKSPTEGQQKSAIPAEAWGSDARVIPTNHQQGTNGLVLRPPLKGREHQHAHDIHANIPHANDNPQTLTSMCIYDPARPAIDARIQMPCSVPGDLDPDAPLHVETVAGPVGRAQSGHESSAHCASQQNTSIRHAVATRRATSSRSASGQPANSRRMWFAVRLFYEQLRAISMIVVGVA